jgi:UDP-glucuronate decarboxylase
MIRIMNSRESFTTAVNVGNPNEFTILELALKLTGSKSKIIYQPLPSDDPMQIQPDIF